GDGASGSAGGRSGGLGVMDFCSGGGGKSCGFTPKCVATVVEKKLLRRPQRGVRPPQRAQVPPQTLGAPAWNQTVDLSMGAPPDRNGAREQRATRGREFEPAAASGMGVDHHRNQAAPLQRFERAGERRAPHGQQGRDRRESGRRGGGGRVGGGGGAVGGRHGGVVPGGQAERPQHLVETARERARRALQVKAQARVPNQERGREGNFGRL